MMLLTSILRSEQVQIKGTNEFVALDSNGGYVHLQRNDEPSRVHGPPQDLPAQRDHLDIGQFSILCHLTDSRKVEKNVAVALSTHILCVCTNTPWQFLSSASGLWYYSQPDPERIRVSLAGIKVVNFFGQIS